MLIWEFKAQLLRLRWLLEKNGSMITPHLNIYQIGKKKLRLTVANFY